MGYFQDMQPLQQKTVATTSEETPKKYGKKPRLVNSSVTQDPFPGMESFMGKGKNEGKKIETIDVQSRMHPLVW
jgi:hypothetical protein